MRDDTGIAYPRAEPSAARSQAKGAGGLTVSEVWSNKEYVSDGAMSQLGFGKLCEELGLEEMSFESVRLSAPAQRAASCWQTSRLAGSHLPVLRAPAASAHPCIRDVLPHSTGRRAHECGIRCPLSELRGLGAPPSSPVACPCMQVYLMFTLSPTIEDVMIVCPNKATFQRGVESLGCAAAAPLAPLQLRVADRALHTRCGGTGMSPAQALAPCPARKIVCPPAPPSAPSPRSRSAPLPPSPRPHPTPSRPCISLHLPSLPVARH